MASDLMDIDPANRVSNEIEESRGSKEFGILGLVFRSVTRNENTTTPADM